MRSGDPHGEARALAFGRVKLCGLRTAADLRAAAPAAFGGLVFVPDTPRNVTIDQALAIIDGGDHPPLVGVFRDAPAAFVRDVTRQVPLAAVQLHGGDAVAFEGETWVAEAPGDPIPTADRILFDNGRGGTGVTFDWSRIAGRAELPRALLAGGIGAHNAVAARRVGAYALDIGSSVDEAPGSKSHARIAELFATLRPLSRQKEILSCA
jgi:indole-3-glycerol phosphate synthase/phosphoribosylanthranilate isomerase